jgi:hypothetical protein
LVFVFLLVVLLTGPRGIRGRGTLVAAR